MIKILVVALVYAEESMNRLAHMTDNCWDTNNDANDSSDSDNEYDDGWNFDSYF